MDDIDATTAAPTGAHAGAHSPELFGAFQGRRVLVTGGAGFIGSELVTHLLRDAGAAHVRVLDNLETGSRANLGHLTEAESEGRLEVRLGDVTDPDGVAAALSDVDTVFHLACLGVRHSLHAPVLNHRVNAEGALIVARAAQEADVRRYVHVSSSEIYGTARYAPMDEEHPARPETVYGAGKLAGEAYARAHHRTYGLPVVVARPFNTYGPRGHFEGDSGEVIPRTIVRALCGLRPLVFGDGEQTRDFTHVHDTARGLIALALADDAVGHTVNLGSGVEVSINTLVRRIAELTDLSGPVARHLDARPGDVRRLVVDATRMRALTGWRPEVDLETGLADLVAWFQNAGESPTDMLSRIQQRNWVAS